MSTVARGKVARIWDLSQNVRSDVQLTSTMTYVTAIQILLSSKQTVHLTREDFDALHALAASHIEQPMDVLCHHGLEQRLPSRRRLNSVETLFMFLDILGRSNEGGSGIERVSHRYGLSLGTVLNYFRHVLFAVFKTLDAIEPCLVRWPDEGEQEAAEGLIVGFPHCVFFVDGNKSKLWRPVDNHEQERVYDGYKKAHVWSILVYCDLFGKFIRVEITDKSAESDRNFYTNSQVYQNKEEVLSDEQHGMADMGFGGPRALVLPYKRNESTNWMFRTLHNRYIRAQR